MENFKWLVLCCVLFAMPVQATSLGVWPINPRIDPPESSTSIWVRNNSQDMSVVLQVRVLAWSQDEDTDIYAIQNQLVVSPAMTRVAPGAQQLFRIVNRRGAVKVEQHELSYRVLIDEIPQPDSINQSTLNFQMRYSLPLFIGFADMDHNNMTADKQQVLEAGLRYELIDGKAPRLRIHNHSRLHARISHLKVVRPGQKDAVLFSGLAGYVLPDASQSWDIDKERWQLLQAAGAYLVFQQERRELKIAVK